MANVGGGKPMSSIVLCRQFFERTDLLAPLNLVHLSPAGDTKQILEHVPARIRLKLVLVKIGRIVAISTVQEAP
jgi:hypothetical protein